MPGAASTRPSARSGRFLNIQRRGNIVLPPDIRKQLHLDSDGAQVEMILRPDGVLELRPHLAVPLDQAWFWTEEWQAGEREVDEQIAAGRVVEYDSADDFAAYLADVDSPTRA